ncbi:MAG: hypothetical protein ACRDMJ_18130, partial [Solirubrobacteraceae bacterium]
FAVGDALAVPRHPTLLPHDAATPSQMLDRLRCDGAGPIGTFDQVIDREARRVFNTVIGNDPRPHYCHQSNLVGADGGESVAPILCVLLDAVLDRYHAHITPDVPLEQPTLGQAGRVLQRRRAWRRALALGLVSAHTCPAQVTIVNRSAQAVEIPLTGTVAGERYGSCNSGWLAAMPGTTVIEREAGAGA